MLGIGLLTIAYGTHLHAKRIRNQAIAQLTAEAGYESGVCWLSDQNDVRGDLSPASGTGRVEYLSSDDDDFPGSCYDCYISFEEFSQGQPVYKIIANGYSGFSASGAYTSDDGRSWNFSRTVEASVVRKFGGWEMGMCKRPDGPSRIHEKKVNFTKNDVIEIPIHINRYYKVNDLGDTAADIYIDKKNKPEFKEPVSMGESRYKGWGRSNKDKYKGTMSVFKGGIYFNQPDSKIAGVGNDYAGRKASLDSIKKKVDRFKNSITNSEFCFNGSSDPNFTVQLEFYVKGYNGMVRITEDCNVNCVNDDKYNYKIDLSSVATVKYEKYSIYGGHQAGSEVKDWKLSDTYISRKAKLASGGEESASGGGQIYVDGNVIIGGQTENGKVDIDGTWYESRIKGKVMVVATGNIWIVNSVMYAGDQEDISGAGFTIADAMPSANNMNVLGLFSQYGVVKIADLSQVPFNDPGYNPVGNSNNVLGRYELPEPTIVQAAITVCGGGFGVENLGTRVESTNNNKLIVVGSIVEAVRGLAANPEVNKNDGFRKCYYYDARFESGILPGELQLGSKYVPVSGGWSDY